MTTQIQSFKPIVWENSEILILGSMPGVESLRRNEYYAKSTNSFWRILFELTGESYSDDYDTKKLLLKKYKIAVWDVLKYCDRIGSLDSNIKNEEVNDFETFFKTYGHLKYIYFNGKKAYDTFMKNINLTSYNHLEFVRLPSTSAAHAIKFVDKLDHWSIIIEKN